MSNPLDMAKYNVVNAPMQNMPVQNPQANLASMYQMAMQNPNAFEEHFKRTNPQAYEQAKMLSKIKSPRDIVTQLLNKRGINPNLFMANR